MEVNFTPTSEDSYNGNLQIFSNTDSYSLEILGNGSTTPNSNDAVAFTNLTISNYPNPFQNSTTLNIHGIKIRNLESIFIILKDKEFQV